MYRSNGTNIHRALAQATAELTEIQSEASAAKAALLADALARNVGTLAGQFTADLTNAAAAIAALIERERLVQSRVDVLTELQTAFNVSFN